jgi:hypothetical protein
LLPSNSWSCLYIWLQQSSTCPVCKGAASQDTVIPVYVQGNTTGNQAFADFLLTVGNGTLPGLSDPGTDFVDPRTTTPPRPQAHREPPPTQARGFGLNAFSGANFNAFVGVPFLGLHFNLGGGGGVGTGGARARLEPGELLMNIAGLMLILVFLGVFLN